MHRIHRYARHGRTARRYPPGLCLRGGNGAAGAARVSPARAALRPLLDRYDYILIDCPPSLGLLTINALTAANSVLIPIQCEYYALEGVTSLMDTVARIKRGLNASLDIEGVLLTMLDGRTNLGLQVVAQVKKHFRGKVFATIVTGAMCAWARRPAMRCLLTAMIRVLPARRPTAPWRAR